MKSVERGTKKKREVLVLEKTKKGIEKEDEELNENIY